MERIFKISACIFVGVASGALIYSITSLPSFLKEMESVRLVASIVIGFYIFIKLYKDLQREKTNNDEVPTRKEVKVKIRKNRKYFFKKT